MALIVHALFPTLQGEGSRTGQPAIFVRLAGCNLWSGHAELRAKGAGDCAGWCDTDFVGGERLEGHDLAQRVIALAKAEGMAAPLVVFTGGEPLLQLASQYRQKDVSLLMQSLRLHGAEIALETNGTKEIPSWLGGFFDHVTVSPKGLRSDPGSVEHLRPLAEASDLKIVVPCPMPVEDLLAVYPGARLYFQPRDEGGDHGSDAFAQACRLAALHGGRVSIQTHKLMGLP